MFDEQEINNLSKKYDFVCNVFPNAIYINSVYRNWICMKQGGCYKLFHLNGEQCKHKNHLHKKQYKTLKEVFEYCKNHDNQIVLDRYRYNRRMERLFNQIHT